MAWYRTGTVSVTNGSTTVTGTGTSWIAGAGIGEALYAPDGRIYEIANIASDTSITLASGYQGTNASGASYVIIPSQSYIRDLASDAANLISQYSTIATNAGAGKFGDGTLSTPGITFSSDLDTGIRRVGTNSLALVSGAVDRLSINTTGATFSNNLVVNGNTTLGDATTDSVQVNGFMSVGGAASTNVGVYVRNTALTASSQTGVQSEIVSSSAATSSVRSFASFPSTAAAAFTTINLSGVYLADAVKGAGSTITNQHGIYIADQTQGTNNYGINSLVSSGTNKWNIYASGTAANYFAGNVGIGTPSVGLSGERLTVYNTASPTAVFRLTGGTNNPYLLIRHTEAGAISTIDVNSAVAAPSLAFAITNTERMRIDSSGNVGIGTSSPLAAANYTTLSINGQNGGALALYANGTIAGSVAAFTNDIYYDSVDATIFRNGAAFNGTPTERMRLDSSGNLGLGVVPGTWATSVKAIELAYPTFGMASNGGAFVSFNARESSVGNWVYKSTDEASRFELNPDGGFRFFTAPSGTAGNAISFTQAMTLDASSRLTVGTTTNTNSSTVVSGGTISETVSSTQYLIASQYDIGTAPNEVPLNQFLGSLAYQNANAIGPITTTSVTTPLISYAGTLALAATGANIISLQTNSSERVRIDSSGNVGIGLSSFNDRLTVQNVDTTVYTATGSTNLPTGGSITRIQNTSNTDGSFAGITISTNLTAGTAAQAYILGYSSSGSLAATMVFGQRTGSATYAERMRIDTSGNVGIGATSPQRRLHVYGTTTTFGGTRSNVQVSDSAAMAAGVGGGIILSGNATTGQTDALTTFGAIHAEKENATSADTSGALVLSTRPNGSDPQARVWIDSVGNVQVRAGAVVVYAPAPASISTTATLTNANIQTQIINTTGTSYTVTMPLGTTLETLVPWASVDIGYNFTIINSASGTITIATNTGVTALGALTIATGVSAQFRIRRTAANTFVLYRIS